MTSVRDEFLSSAARVVLGENYQTAPRSSAGRPTLAPSFFLPVNWKLRTLKKYSLSIDRGDFNLIYSMAAQVTPAERPVLIKEEHVPTREDQAHKVIMQNVVWAVGGGALPLPLIDMIAITVVNVKMLKELSAVYEVPFREDQVKSILSALLAGLGAP